jgi:hypothetical protein
MKPFYTGLFFRHPVGEWRVFSGYTSKALGPVEPNFLVLWERRK